MNDRTSNFSLKSLADIVANVPLLPRIYMVEEGGKFYHVKLPDDYVHDPTATRFAPNSIVVSPATLAMMTRDYNFTPSKVLGNPHLMGMTLHASTNGESKALLDYLCHRLSCFVKTETIGVETGLPADWPFKSTVS